MHINVYTYIDLYNLSAHCFAGSPGLHDMYRASHKLNTSEVKVVLECGGVKHNIRYIICITWILLNPYWIRMIHHMISWSFSIFMQTQPWRLIDRATSIANIFAFLLLGRTPQRWMVRPTYPAICDFAAMVDAKTNLPTSETIHCANTNNDNATMVGMARHAQMLLASVALATQNHAPATKLLHKAPRACRQQRTVVTPKAILEKTQAANVQHTCNTRATECATRAFLLQIPLIFARWCKICSFSFWSGLGTTKVARKPLWL